MRFQSNETFRAQVKFAVDLSPTKTVGLGENRESEVVTFSIHTHLSREFLKPYLEKVLTHTDTHASLPYPTSPSRLPCKSPGNRKKTPSRAPCHVHGLSPKVSSVHYASAAGASATVKRRKKRGGERGVLREETPTGRAFREPDFPLFLLLPTPTPRQPGGIPGPQRAGNNAEAGPPPPERPPLTTQVSAPLPPAPAPPPPALAMAGASAHRPRGPGRRCCLPAGRPAPLLAPNAPLAELLAAPPPAPHRRDPVRTPGLAH